VYARRQKLSQEAIDYARAEKKRREKKAALKAPVPTPATTATNIVH
jgi:hypothetical protein